MPTPNEFVKMSQEAISRAQKLLTAEIEGREHPIGHVDLNAVVLELNEAFGLLATLSDVIGSPFNNREVAIMLAALRIGQRDLDSLNSMPHMDEETCFAGEEEIDDLCEKINMGEVEGYVTQAEYNGAVELLRQIQAGDVEDSIWREVSEIVEENDRYYAQKHATNET